MGSGKVPQQFVRSRGCLNAIQRKALGRIVTIKIRPSFPTTQYPKSNGYAGNGAK
jgi:hypothetical protein